MSLNSIERVLPVVIATAGTVLTVSQIVSQGVMISVAGVVAGIATSIFMMYVLSEHPPRGPRRAFADPEPTSRVYFANGCAAAVLGVLMPLEQKFDLLPRLLQVARPVFFGNPFFLGFRLGITATIAVAHGIDVCTDRYPHGVA